MVPISLPGGKKNSSVGCHLLISFGELVAILNSLQFLSPTSSRTYYFPSVRKRILSSVKIVKIVVICG